MMEKLFSILSNLQTTLFWTNLQQMDQHAGVKWLMHGPKHRKENQSKTCKNL